MMIGIMAATIMFMATLFMKTLMANNKISNLF